MAKVKAEPKAPRKANGNVTIDLGEAIEKRFRAAGMSGGTKAKKGYRPGLFGGYRPGYAFKGHGGWKMGAMMKLPATLNAKDVVTGAAIGIVGNRVLSLVTTHFSQLKSKLAVDAINFGVGLVPYLAKQNSMNVGIAIPGFVFLAGSLTDMVLDKSGLFPDAWVAARKSLGTRLGGADAAIQARQRLAEIQARLAGQARGAQPPRVQARPQIVA